MSSLSIYYFDPIINFNNEKIVNSVFSQEKQIKPIDSLFNKDNYEISDDPKYADFIILHYDLTRIILHLGLFGLAQLFHNNSIYREYHYKFIFYLSEDTPFLVPLSGTWLRESVDSTINSEQSICLPYIIGEKPNLKIKKTRKKYNANFIGAIHTHPIRIKMYNALEKFNDNQNYLLKPRKKFTSAYSTEDQKKNMQELFDGIRSSYLTLCPRGTGMNSRRYFEVLSLGEMPVLFSDKNIVLPFEEKIDYTQFTINLSYEQVDKFHDIYGSAENLTTDRMNAIEYYYNNFLCKEKCSIILSETLKEKQNRIYKHRKKEFSTMKKFTKDIMFEYIFNLIKKSFQKSEYVNCIMLLNYLKKLGCETSQVNALNDLEAQFQNEIGWINHNFFRRLDVECSGTTFKIAPYLTRISKEL